ncbi:GNAT family protein [Devosia sp. FKR38]|uniref:GNAT family N-acetyltransferase n=1 Tax=Devosia sp. FKR38 TaxID=2562312 RepID=UPI0010C057A5|nr:GNAT family protein [Devosia sp. FKR38]
MPANAPVLVGKLVTLRPFGAEDITDQYIGWLNDPRVVRFSNQRFRRHDAESCAAYLASFQHSANHFVSIRRRADDKAIGTMTAYVSLPHQTVDVGIMVGAPEVWGQGYGQDAWNTLLAWLADRADIRKITAGTLEGNIGMQRLMQRSGMTLEARRVAQEIVEGQPQDIVYYARFTDR